MPGARTVRGGFDSHASPPFLFRAVGCALITAILVVIPFYPGAAKAAEGSGPPPGRAALQSLLVPGFGQVANRKWIKAVGFTGAYGGLLFWGVSLNQDKQDAVGRLHAGAPEDLFALQNEVDSLEDNRNAKFWFAGLTLLLSMADAYVDAHLSGFDQRIDAEVGWVPERDGHFLGVKLTAAWGGEIETRNRGS